MASHPLHSWLGTSAPDAADTKTVKQLRGPSSYIYIFSVGKWFFGPLWATIIVPLLPCAWCALLQYVAATGSFPFLLKTSLGCRKYLQNPQLKNQKRADHPSGGWIVTKISHTLRRLVAICCRSAFLKIHEQECYLKTENVSVEFTRVNNTKAYHGGLRPC